MSERLFFYKIKIFTEDASIFFEPDDIFNALKALVGTKNLDGDDKLQTALFEEIQDVDPQFREVDDKISDFLNRQKKEDNIPDTGFFMMTDEILNAIKERLSISDKESNLSQETKKEENAKNERPENNQKIREDYEKLKQVFEKRLLIARSQT